MGSGELGFVWQVEIAYQEGGMESGEGVVGNGRRGMLTRKGEWGVARSMESVSFATNLQPNPGLLYLARACEAVQEHNQLQLSLWEQYTRQIQHRVYHLSAQVCLVRGTQAQLTQQRVQGSATRSRGVLPANVCMARVMTPAPQGASAEREEGHMQ